MNAGGLDLSFGYYPVSIDILDPEPTLIGDRSVESLLPTLETIVVRNIIRIIRQVLQPAPRLVAATAFLAPFVDNGADECARNNETNNGCNPHHARPYLFMV